MNRRDFLKLVAFLPFASTARATEAYLWTVKGGAQKRLYVIAALQKIAFPFGRISRDIPEPVIECVPDLMSSDGTIPVTGRFSPSTGKILIKANQPAASLKMAVKHEMGHLVDYYMPMTDLMRARISRLLHGDNSGVWWSGSHSTSDGEAFGWRFGGAYSSNVPYESAWTPPITKAMMPRVRRILHVPRVRTPQF
jgi:hypothetical protein